MKHQVLSPLLVRSHQPVLVVGLVGALLACRPDAGLWAAETSTLDSLNLEAHGFVSFGYLRTWENNVYAADSTDGTTEFYEAAMNAIARPWDRVRLGAQLFVRDFGRYDNGRVELDWAYVDVQAHPLCDIQVGRVKIPLGFYNEIQDIDAARTEVFLPQAVYPTRLRELLVSVDGGKVSGRAELDAAGALAYTVFAGTKHFDNDGAYATYVGETARIAVTDISVGAVFGGMLQWETPLPDFRMRLTYYQSNDIEVDGPATAGPPLDVHFVSDSRSMVASLEWEPHDWTFALEYLNIATEGESTSGATVRPYEFDYNGGYASATWHTSRWLELYAAAEYRRSELLNRPTTYSWSWVGAVNLMPLRNWTLKAEYQFQDGTNSVLSSDNPQGINSYWHLFALKTTVDF